MSASAICHPPFLWFTQGHPRFPPLIEAIDVKKNNIVFMLVAHSLAILWRCLCFLLSSTSNTLSMSVCLALIVFPQLYHQLHRPLLYVTYKPFSSNPLYEPHVRVPHTGHLYLYTIYGYTVPHQLPATTTFQGYSCRRRKDAF